MRKIPLAVKLFLSYVLVLIIPTIAISSVLYSRLLSTYETKMNDSIARALADVEERNNTWRSFVSNLSIIIALDEKTAQLGGAQTPIDKIFETISYGALLNSLQITYSVVDSIYVYIEDNETVYTSYRNQYSADAFNDRQWLEHEVANAEWIGVRSAPLISLSGGPENYTNYITYVRRINPHFMRKKGYVVVNINESKMYNLLIEGNELDCLYILDADDVIISCGDKNLLGQTYQDKNNIWADVDQLRPGEYLVCSDESSASLFKGVLNSSAGMKYVGSIDSSHYLHDIKAANAFTLLVCIACVLLGLPLCYILSRQMTSPVSLLLKQIDQKDFPGESADDADMVRRALGNIVSKNAWYANWFVGHKSVNKNGSENLLERLKNAKMNVTLDVQEYERLFLPYVTVLNVSVDEPKRVLPDENLLAYLGQILFELFDKAISQTHKVYAVRTGECSTALVISYEEEHAYSSLPEAIQAVKRQLYLLMETNTISISYSRLKHRDSSIGEAVDEAEKAMRWKLRSGCNSVIPYVQEMDGEMEFYYPRDRINRVSAAMHANGSTPLEEALDSLFECMDQSSAEIDDLIMIYHQLISWLIQHMTARNIKPTDVFGEDEAYLYQYLTRFEAMDGINKWIKSLFMRFKDFDDSYVQHKNRYLADLVAYVQENYNRDLAPADMAAKLGISYSYMRRLLNAEMGTNFVDYLNSVRLQHAKRMLANGSYLIKDVAEKTGFSNEQSFTRAFKKNEGMSPGSYRRSLI